MRQITAELNPTSGLKIKAAELLSDRIGILQGGELERLGTLEHLYRSMPKTYRLVYNSAGESAERASSESVVYDAADFEGFKKSFKRGVSQNIP